MIVRLGNLVEVAGSAVIEIGKDEKVQSPIAEIFIRSGLKY